MTDRLTAMSTFARVVEAKSFSAAALALRTSKSRVSRQVSALEAALAVRLLNRSTRKLSLTEAGALLYEHCANIVREAELAEERLRHAQSEPEGEVKVTAVAAFAIRHVLPALTAFQQAYPKIRVVIACSNRRALDLGSERYDLGIRIATAKLDSGLVARKLAENRAVPCASPSYLAQHGTPRRIQDLARRECIRFAPIAPQGTWTFRRGRRTSTVKISGAIETDEMEAVRAAVLAGLGIGVLPLYMINDDLGQGRLVPLLRPYQFVPETAIYVVYPPNRTLPARVRAFIDFLVARFAPTPPWEHTWRPATSSSPRRR